MIPEYSDLQFIKKKKIHRIKIEFGNTFGLKIGILKWEKNLLKRYYPLLRKEFKLQAMWTEQQWAAKHNNQPTNMLVAMVVSAWARAVSAFSKMGHDQKMPADTKRLVTWSWEQPDLDY